MDAACSDVYEPKHLRPSPFISEMAWQRWLAEFDRRQRRGLSTRDALWLANSGVLGAAVTS